MIGKKELEVGQKIVGSFNFNKEQKAWQCVIDGDTFSTDSKYDVLPTNGNELWRARVTWNVAPLRGGRLYRVAFEEVVARIGDIVIVNVQKDGNKFKALPSSVDPWYKKKDQLVSFETSVKMGFEPKSGSLCRAEIFGAKMDGECLIIRYALVAKESSGLVLPKPEASRPALVIDPAEPATKKTQPATAFVPPLIIQPKALSPAIVPPAEPEQRTRPTAITPLPANEEKIGLSLTPHAMARLLEVLAERGLLD